MHHYTIEEAAYLAEVVDSSDDAIITKTLKSVIRTWNPAAERIFGYTAQEAVGQSVLLIIPSGHQHEENIILTRIRNGERLEHFDTVRLRKDGRLIDVSLTVSPVRDPKGVIIGASKIARDITERKKTEQALAELHGRLTVTLASIGDAVVATDVDSHVTYVNPAAENLLGYSSPLLVGRPLREIFNIINAYTRRRVDSPVDEVLRRGVIVGLANHTILLRPDGKEIPIADSAAPIKDALGRCLGVVLVFRDVSEQYKAARQAVLLSAIVANSDDAIISKDLAGQSPVGIAEQGRYSGSGEGIIDFLSCGLFLTTVKQKNRTFLQELVVANASTITRQFDKRWSVVYYFFNRLTTHGRKWYCRWHIENSA